MRSYPSGVRANQLDTLAHIGVTTNLPTGAQPSLAAIDDPLHAAEEIAPRGYLHVNCWVSSPGRPDVHDTSYATALHDMGVQRLPTIDDLASYIPGNPVLLRRVSRNARCCGGAWTPSILPGDRTRGVARTTTHEVAAWVLGGWIENTPFCP